MEILLIGGTGILSSEICANAIKKGYNVTILNRGLRKDFINKEARFVKADIRNDTVDIIKNKINIHKKYDVVIDFITYNVEQLKKSIQIVQNMTKQYIFISSATAYKNVEGRYTEECEIGNDIWDYCLEKSECEWYLSKKKDDFSFKYTIVRPYVTYGRTRIPYQIAPIEYYTILNRIMNNKPIPICGIDTRCTLTNAKDFAVGVVGLFLNEAAYGEAVHITANADTTWKEAIEIIANKLNKKITFVDINKHYLYEHSKEAGIDIDEILGDKSRNMIFDNQKIKRLVPEYKGEIGFEEGIDKTLEYYKNNPEKRIINYSWDAKIDRLIKNYLRTKNISVKNSLLNITSYKNKLTIKEIGKYMVNRYSMFTKIKTLIKH